MATKQVNDISKISTTFLGDLKFDLLDQQHQIVMELDALEQRRRKLEKEKKVIDVVLKELKASRKSA